MTRSRTRRAWGATLAGLIASISLSACDEASLAAAGGGLTETRVLGGSLVIPAPPGYCIDPKTSVARGQGVVALIGRCRADGALAPAVVTLTVGGPGSAAVLVAGPEALARYFASPAGRRVLARDGVASHVAVLQTRVDHGALLMQVKDRMAGDYWRAITAVRGRLVTISASGATGAPLTPAQGLKLVRDEAALLVRRNAETATASPPSSGP